MSSVKLDEVVFDESIYPRASWSQATIDRYADALNAGEHFPAIVLEAGTRRLLDGKHRVEAHRQIGRPFVAADFVEVPEGVPPVLYAASLSSRHGDPLADTDRRRVAREVAEANPDYSIVMIAKLLGATRQTVSRYVGDIVERRREVRRAQALLLDRAGWSHRQIGEHLHVDHKTVGSDVTSNISPHSEDILREAAAGLPVDAEPLIAAVLAEGDAPEQQDTQTPGPVEVGAPAPSADLGTIDRPVDEATPASTPPTDPRADGESPAAGFAVGDGAGDPAEPESDRFQFTCFGCGKPFVAVYSADGNRCPKCGGSGTNCKPLDELEKPAEVSAGQVETERMETQRVQILDRARRRAPRLVPEIRDLITEVISGMNLGETGLVTPDMVADLRALVDALEARMEATQ